MFRQTAMTALVTALLLPTSAALADDTQPLAYQEAVTDAAFPTEEEIVDNLTPITADNAKLVWNADHSKIRVVSWKSEGSYKSFLKPYDHTSDNPDYAIWVTAAPEVRNFCRTFVKDHPEADQADLNLRLKQFLGLDPSWTYDVFVEFWVAPDTLFRPCTDPQTDDTTCNLHFGDSNPQVTNIPDYREFYSNLYYKSFRSGGGVPWTGIGYTYDWGNPAGERGASEFILTPNAPYQIIAATPTAEYCKP
ncbi:hypothetical protein [Endothiovibrio diazotrophicus]